MSGVTGRVADQRAVTNDEGDSFLRKYRTETPNVVYDMGLDPFAGWLYGHLKRIAGDSGVCWKGVRTLAGISGMSVGKVVAAKKTLVERGLICVREGDRTKGEADEIRVTNIWRENFENFAGEGDSPVRNMSTPFAARTPRSPRERKKEHSKKEHKETLADASAKKAGVSKPIRKLSEKEASERFETLCASDPNGAALRELSGILAAENKTGRVTATRVWRELGSRYVLTREREQLSDEAWAYGFDQAITHEAPNIGYVSKAGKGYRTERVRRGGEGSGADRQPAAGFTDGYEFLFRD